MIRIVRVNPENAFVVIQDAYRMVDDYARRSKDPADVHGVFASAACLAGIGVENILFIVVYNDNEPVGYFIWTVVDNPLMGEKYVSPIQGYLKPGGPRFAQVFPIVESVVRPWADRFGARRMLHASYRHGRAYEKVMSKVGFRKIAEVYEKIFEEEVKHAGQGEQAGSDHSSAE